MRLILTLLITTFILSKSLAQGNKPTDFSKVDKWALQAPDSVTTDIEKLASYLTTTSITASSDKKIRAIFVWVSQNIRYDKSFNLSSPFTTVEVVATQNADRVLAARMGVCMGYTQLFVALAQAAGLKAEMVEGIVKQNDGNIPRMGHAWVAVRLRRRVDKDEKAETRWYLCDPTWATPQSKAEFGNIKEEYFLVEPEDFIKDHMPLDPMWQLVEHPATIDIFSKESDEKIKKYVSKSSKNPFIFQDTINRVLKMDSLKRLDKSTWRMLHYNPVNEYIWFEVGKVYSNRFNAFEDKITTLIQNSLAESTLLADDEKVENMLGIMRLYAETFKDCFSKIEDTLIQKQNEFYSDAYLNALISTYRSGFQTAYLNKIIESNNKITPRFFENITMAERSIDSTMTSARKSIKSLDSNTQRSIEIRLQLFEKIVHQKQSLFLFQYLETLRAGDVVLSQKREIYDLLSLGRLHTRKYQECVDSMNVIMIGTKHTPQLDNFFENYSFLFDIEDCAWNSKFLFEEINEKAASNSSKNLIFYIQTLKDVYACANNVKDKWKNKSKTVVSLIEENTDFFKEISASNESQMGYLCHSIAISIWNENLTKNNAVIKSDMLYYLNLSENSFNKTIEIYTELLKNKAYQNVFKNQITILEEKKKEVLKLKKEIE